MVSQSESFQNPVVDETLTATSFAIPDYTLSASRTYYVKVTGNVGGTTEETDVFTFTTEAAELTAPVFVVPAADGATIHSDEVVSVQPQAGVASTHFNISEKDSFPVRSSYNGTYDIGEFSTPALGEVKMVSKALEDGKTYYLRAQFNYYNAAGTYTTTDWSDVLTFVYSAEAGITNVNADALRIVDNVLFTDAASQAVNVFALDGKLVLSAQTDVTGALDLSHLAKATYLVAVGNKTVKFVKK